MEAPDPTSVWEKFQRNKIGFVLGLILLGGVVVVLKYVSHKTDQILVGGSPRTEKAPPPVAEKAPPAKPAPAPAPTAPQPSVAQKSDAPAEPPPPVKATVTPPPPQPPAPCGHVSLPVKPAALATASDKLCALAACTGQPHDAPAIEALRTWSRLARNSKPCDLADREALGNYDVLKRLVAIASAPSTATRADERASCLDARQALIDDITSANTRLDVDEKAQTRCGATAQKAASEAVERVVGQLR